MVPPSSDPAGLLARVPELEPLCRYDSVRRAVERGDGFALHRALMIGGWLGRFRGPDIDTARALAAQRRLFLKPLRGAPWLYTLNGVGTSAYGQDERGEDGAYVLTHFLVLLFVPIFPLGAYLVTDAGQGERGWVFFGRVPLGPLTWAWNRLVVLGVLLAVLAGVGSAVHASMFNDVYVVNGLDQPVRVRIGTTEHEVPPRLTQPTIFTVGRGAQPVETRTLDGRVIEQATFDPRSGSDAHVWNVLGAAPVFVETVIYSEVAAFDRTPEPQVHCGEASIEAPRVDYAFEDAPSSLSVSSRSSQVTKYRLAVDPNGFSGCLEWLSSHDRPDVAAAMIERVGQGLGWNLQLFERLESVAVRSPDREVALRAARAWRDAEPAALDAHRAYQNEMVRLGRRDELRGEYDAWRAARPGDLDAEYLALRFAPSADAAARASELLASRPDHVPLLRIVAHHQLESFDYASAVTSFESLARLESTTERFPSLEGLVRALVATGRTNDARALLAREIASAPPPDQAGIARLHARLGEPDPLALHRTLSAVGDDAPMPGLWMRVLARLPITPTELEGLDPESRTYVRAVLETTTNPASALAAARELPTASLSRLETDLYVLLYGEACRSEGPSSAIAQHLASANPSLAEPIARFVVEGVHSPVLDDLPLEAQAAVNLVRSRVTTLAPEERTALRDRAVRGDPLGDGAARAASSWPEAI